MMKKELLALPFFILLLSADRQTQTRGQSDSVFVEEQADSVSGTIMSIDLVECSFELQTKEGRRTFLVNPSTTFSDSLNLSVLDSGEQVKVMFRSDNNSFIASKVNRIEKKEEKVRVVEDISDSSAEENINSKRTCEYHGVKHSK